MNRIYYIQGKKISLNPKYMIAKGGEAEIYDLQNGMVAKLFKQSNHSDYVGLPDEQQSAQQRIKSHQQKLSSFPKNLPQNCLVPQELITDQAGQVLGYTMPFIKDAVPLLKYSDRQFRLNSGISSQQVCSLFLQLHQLVEQIHQAGIVIGDFNDLNILVKDQQIYAIDTDSWQFGAFLCSMFSVKFVDPLICNSHANSLMLQQAYIQNSDWYSFTVMLFQSLLCVNPYGGIHKPHDPSKKIIGDRRILSRCTVFHPEVQYPKPAIPYHVLSQQLIDYFHAVFVRDLRQKFPQNLLEISWQRCSNCHLEHQHLQCPNCQTTVTLSQTTILKELVVTQVFCTQGIVLHAQIQDNKLVYLYHHQSNFYREDNLIILQGQLSSQYEFGLCGRDTLFFQSGQLVIISPSQNIEIIGTRAFAANSQHYYWITQEQLVRNGDLGYGYIGEIISDRTRFWVGEYFGLGFYLVGNILTTFVFDALRQGINDQVKIPLWRGELVDCNCIFADDLAWLLLVVKEQGHILPYCHVINRQGKLLVSQAIDQLGLHSIYTPCAVNNYLFVPTDAGVQRWQITGQALQLDKCFLETSDYVNANTRLLVSAQGLWAIAESSIFLLQN